MATDPAIQQQLDESRERVEKSRKEYDERTKGKPTPTQEENDRAKLGEHVLEKEDDGSGPDPHDASNKETQRRHTEAAKPSGSYQTRDQRAAPPRSVPRSTE